MSFIIHIGSKVLIHAFFYIFLLGNRSIIKYFFYNPSDAIWNFIVDAKHSVTWMYAPGHQMFAFGMKFQWVSEGFVTLLWHWQEICWSWFFCQNLYKVIVSIYKQVNKATSYIDGSFVYGNQALRALYLKEVKSSKMASGDGWYKYPERNKDGLPFVMNPDPVEHKFRDYLSFWSKKINWKCIFMVYDIKSATC